MQLLIYFGSYLYHFVTKLIYLPNKFVVNGFRALILPAEYQMTYFTPNLFGRYINLVTKW
jgi:hypothetical protein